MKESWEVYIEYIHVSTLDYAHTYIHTYDQEPDGFQHEVIFAGLGYIRHSTVGFAHAGTRSNRLASMRHTSFAHEFRPRERTRNTLTGITIGTYSTCTYHWNNVLAVVVTLEFLSRASKRPRRGSDPQRQAVCSLLPVSCCLERGINVVSWKHPPSLLGDANSNGK